MNPMRKQKKRPNYFRKQEERFGQNFLARKSANDLQNDAKMVFRDLARGNIEYPRDLQYFMNAQFLFNIHKVAYDEYIKHYMNQLGTSTYLSTYANSITDEIKTSMEGINKYNTIMCNLYATLSYGLQNITGILVVNTDEDVIKDAMLSLTNQLYPYRYQM